MMIIVMNEATRKQLTAKIGRKATVQLKNQLNLARLSGNIRRVTEIESKIHNLASRANQEES